MLLPGERRKAKAINVLPPGNAGDGNKGNIAIKNTSYGAYDISKVLPPGEHHKRKL